MNKAAKLSAQLGKMTVEAGIAWIMETVEGKSEKPLHFNVIGDTMFIMHDDGSVNMIESGGDGPILSMVISAENIFKVLEYYRPFSEVFGWAGSKN